MRNVRTLVRRPPAVEEPPPLPEHEVCISCNADLEGSRSYERQRVCHSCGFHFHLGARERVAALVDTGSFRETDRGVTNIDPISFSLNRSNYRSRVINAQRRTRLAEAALTGTGTIFGREVVVAVLDFSFLGGSIGIVAGERLARAFEKATARKGPIVTVTSTSGTRMQEGILALMQLPRVMAAALRHAQAGVPHIGVLTDPTTGSAYAGFLNLADYLVAEPNALVGYAALAALEASEGADLPRNAHTAEAHLAHGLIDAIVPRTQLRESVALLLDVLMSDYRLSGPERNRRAATGHSVHTAAEELRLSRHSERPTAADLIGRMTTTFIALRGDRTGSDDPAIIAGIASLGGEPVVIIGQQRPHDGATGGWITAAGFRKATRVIGFAGKFNLPLVTLIDTAGAAPGRESEEAGLGMAIAECLASMLDVRSPTIAVITGEGSSEAAVAMATADRVLMLDNAVYEVIQPEDAARALSQGAGAAAEVAERLRITSHDCLRLQIVDATVPEPGEGAHTDHGEAAVLLRRSILRELTRIQRLSEKTRLKRRYERYRHIGSTRARVRGTIERRLAHLFDRIGGAWDRVRGRRSDLRRRLDFRDGGDIPL